MQLKARMFSAPGFPKNLPDCLQREPMSVLHPALMTPEPIKKPWRRKVLYFEVIPAINALGRLASAEPGVKLWTTTDRAEAEEIAAHCLALNEARKAKQAES
jgi:hypothetical protein